MRPRTSLPTACGARVVGRRDRPRRARTAILLAITLAAAACVSYQQQPLSAEHAQEDFEARSLASEGLRAFVEENGGEPVAEWPPARWDLEELTLAAFYYHPDLDLARARVGVADAAAATAGERPNPSLAATPGRNVSSSGISPWLLTLDLDLPIETAGKRGHRVERARHLSRAARLELASVAWRVRSGVRHALLELEAASETETVLEARIGVLEEVVRRLESQLEAGAVAPLDVTIARTDLDRARLDREDAGRRHAEARVVLAEAVGVPVRALEGLELAPLALDDLPDQLTDARVRREAVTHRADVLQALAEYEASQSDLQLEVARQYPDVHLLPGYELDQGDSKWKLGLSIELPVLSRNRGPIAEAAARREEAAAGFRAVQAKAIGEIDLAVTGYAAARERVALADALVDQQGERRRRIQSLLEAGEIDRLALATVEAELAAGEEARLGALVDAQRALLAVEDAVQRPMPWPESSIEEPPRPLAGEATDESPARAGGRSDPPADAGRGSEA